MANEIKMPQLSDTMYSGKIIAWLKKEGESVSRGDILAEVETDKANLEIESFFDGVLLKIHTPADTEANVGDVIALIGAAGESVASNSKSTASKTQDSPPSVSTETSNLKEELKNSTSSQTAQPNDYNGKDNSERIKASPLAKKIAQNQGLALDDIRGSGPQGRIVKRDVEGVVKKEESYQTPAQNIVSPSAPSAANLPTNLEQQKGVAPTTNNLSISNSRDSSAVGGEGALTPLSKMRATIARRMVESVTQTPHFFVSTSIVMDEAIKLRLQLKEDKSFSKLSLNHLVIKASAYALTKEPRVNRAFKQDMLFTPSGIHIGIVVGLEDGLLIPVVREADKLSLKDLVFEASAGIDRARAGRPTSQDLLGGTFSISNMGMFDVENFTAIINPGQGAILAVSSTKREPVVEGERIVIKSVMRVTLSVDHRIIDGVMAGNFLGHFKKSLESPALLLI
jgi:pyruvate dehydrogenase E2 component (dihydrolipoamide acetyltransferase)